MTEPHCAPSKGMSPASGMPPPPILDATPEDTPRSFGTLSKDEQNEIMLYFMQRPNLGMRAVARRYNLIYSTFARYANRGEWITKRLANSDVARQRYKSAAFAVVAIIYETLRDLLSCFQEKATQASDEGDSSSFDLVAFENIVKLCVDLEGAFERLDAATVQRNKSPTFSFGIDGKEYKKLSAAMNVFMAMVSEHNRVHADAISDAALEDLARLPPIDPAKGERR